MKQDTTTPVAPEATFTSMRVLVDEFVSDIRRRARAVECLLEPRQPPWSFDPDALPTDDAERLVAIKREVEKTFNAIFSDRPRGRGPLVSRRASSAQLGPKNRSATPSAA